MNNGSGIKSPHILILEDDAAHQDLVLRAFREDPEIFRISLAATIREARQLIERDPPDVIIADWLLPDGKGIDILQRRDEMVTVPLVIMTSHGDERLAVELMKSGAIDYVVKSSTMFRELPHLARNALREWDSIRQRQLAEKKLRESETRFRTLVENSGTGIIIIDREGTYLLVNNQAADNMGAPADEIIGKTISDFLPEDTAHQYLARNRETLDAGVKREYEDTFELKTGKKTFFIIDQCLKDSAGRSIALQSISIDITARKQAEQNLRESEEKFRALVNGAGIGVGYWSPDGILLYLNEISLKRLNGKEGDYIGQNVREIFGETAGEMYAERIRQASPSAEPLEFEDFVHLPSGEGWYLSVYSRIVNSDGNVMGIQVLSLDITDRKNAENLRKEYETRLDSAMEIGNLAWWEMDLPGGEVRFDTRKATMLGYPPEKFRHYTDFTTLLHPDDAEPAMQAMRDHLDGKDARYHADYRIITAAGDYRWLRDVGGITRRHPDGTPATVTGIVIDITAGMVAEEKLRESETRFRALIQNSSDIIWIMDKEGRIIYESPSQRVLGYPEGYLVGKDPMEYIHPDDRQTVKKELREVFDRTNTGVPTEFRVRKTDGEYIWVESVGVNLLDVPGVNGIVITTRLIQQRKEAEQALRESEERLRLALEGADIASWDMNLISGNAVFSNRFYTMLGYEPGEIPATYDGWAAQIHPDDRVRVLPDLQRQIREKRPLCEIEYRILSKDGDWLWLVGRGKIVETDDKGNPTRMTGVNLDITSRRLMESEIRSLNTVLEQRVKDRTEALQKVNEALELENAQRVEAENKLRSAYDEKVMLVKEIHHRVKNNLQIIISLLNLQSRYITDEATLAVIKESQTRVRAMSLVHEKLYQADDVSKIEIKDYIRFLGTGLVQFYGAKSRGVRLTLDIGDIGATINTAIPLGLILNELISNSLKYAFPEGKPGEITITVTKEGTALHIRYQDNGVGIPETLDWKNTKSLGLRLVNTLVDQLNGTVELDRSAGTLFTMVLYEKE